MTGGGTITELVGQVPSTVLLVDHALPRTFDKGALGEVVIEGDPNEEIFAVGDPTEGPDAPADDESATGSTTTTTTEEAGDGEPVATEEAGDGEPVATEEAGDGEPVATDEAYTPPVITVAAGTAGTADGTFDSGDLEEGDTFSYTFDEPGEFPYFCIPHPWMHGMVIVTA